MEKRSLRKTCDIFQCSKYSLTRWVQRYLQTGNVKNIQRERGSYKVRQIHVKFIHDSIKRTPTITLSDILVLLHKKFKKFTLSKTHLTDIIKYLNITYKKVQKTHRPDTRYNKPINYKQEYNAFYSKVTKYDLKNIISVDETSMSVGLHKAYGREEIGKRLNKITKDNKVFVKYTLIMAITTKGVVGWTLYKKGGTNHERLIYFLENVLSKKKGKLILMDNASSHRKQEVKDFINSSHNSYVYVLPYHHFQNPIEKFFNQLKHYIKKDEPMSYDDIKKSILKALKNIKDTNFHNYFKSSLRKTTKDIIKTKSKYRKKPKIYKK
jgi:transposase